MSFFVRISNAMQQFSNKKNIITLLLMFIIIEVVMEISPISLPLLKELSGGTGMLDIHFGYNQTQVYKMFDDIGFAGRQIYVKLLGLDFVFSIVFMFLQSLLITALLCKAALNKHFMILNMLPFIRSSLDIIENCSILTLLFNYPGELSLIVHISSAVTILKWIVFIVIIILLFILVVLVIQKSLKNKNKNRGSTI